MKNKDILWLQFDFENIDIQIDIIDGSDLKFLTGRSFKPFKGQRILVQKTNSVVVNAHGSKAFGKLDLKYSIQAIDDYKTDQIDPNFLE